YTFTVPATAVTGDVLTMRAMQQEGGILPLNPCASYSWGAKVDFSIEIGEPAAPPIPCEVVVPDDIVIDLTPGECGRVVSYTVGLMGDCPEITTITQSGFSGPYGQENGLTSNQTFPPPAVPITVDGVVYD